MQTIFLMFFFSSSSFSSSEQLGRVSVDDPESPLRVLGELDILNAYERIRSYYMNIVETLAGGKARA